MTTTGQTAPVSFEALTYLRNGVNTFNYEYEIPADSTTTGFKIRVKNVSGANVALSYRNAQMTVDEIDKIAAYPNTYDDFRETENRPDVVYEPDQKRRVFAEDINNATAAIAAIQATLGLSP